MKQPIRFSLVLATAFFANACADSVEDLDTDESDIEEEVIADGKSDLATDTAKVAALLKAAKQEPFHTYGNNGGFDADAFRRVSALKNEAGAVVGLMISHVRRGDAANPETQSFTEYHLTDAPVVAAAGTSKARYTTYVDTKNNGALEVAGRRREATSMTLTFDAAGKLSAVSLPKTRVPQRTAIGAGTVRSPLTLDAAGYAYKHDGEALIERTWRVDASLAAESNPANIPAPPAQVPGPGAGMPLADAAPWAKAILTGATIKPFATYGVAGPNGETATFRSVSLIIGANGQVRGYLDNFGRPGAVDTASSTGIILLRDGESANGGAAEWLADLTNDGKLQVNGNAEQVRLWIDDNGIRVQGAMMNKLGTNPPEAIRVNVNIDQARYILDGVSGLKQPDGTVVVPEGAPNGGRFFQTSLRVR